MLRAGDVVNCPNWYAHGLIAAGMAELTEEVLLEPVAEKPVEVKASEYKRRVRRK